TDAGHLVDTSGRDEAPRGGGWMPQEYLAVQPSLPGGSSSTFPRTHEAVGDHRTPDGGGSDNAKAPGKILAFLSGFFPSRPNAPETLTNAGASGAGHGGIGYRGMDPSGAQGRRTVDGRMTTGGTLLGHTYTHPIERRKAPLHFNRPTLRRVLAPSINTERGGPSPGGYSSQYDSASSAWSAGPRQPRLRRLIKAYGQAEYDEVSQSPEAARRSNPGPIGNAGW
ncbi:MAG: hypothetical protein ACM30G_04120, partial [Micromonosporaceae bacterium]